MKLKAYIEDELKITVAEAARQLDELQQTIDLIVKEQRIPRKALMKKIRKWSNDAVQPNDFYTDPPEDARANGLDPHPVSQEAAA